MNNLGKIIIGLSLMPSSFLWAGTNQQNDVGLESYLKDYHPQLFKDYEEQGIDLAVIEADARSAVINEEKSFDIPLPIDSKPGHARKLCQKYRGIFLENNYVATCVSKDGTFGNGWHSAGMTFNPAGTGTVISPDYLKPGSPHEYFSVSINGRTFTNNNSNGPAITGTDNIFNTKIKKLDRYTNQEGGVLVNSIIQGPTKDQSLSITQKYTLDPNSREIIVRVEMKNTGRFDLQRVQYARGLDPDQDRPKTYSTLNRIGHSFFPTSPSLIGKVVDVHPSNIAWAEGINSRLSVGLYSVDPVKHYTCISRNWTTIPGDILSQDCGMLSQPIYDRPKQIFGSDYSDSTINIAFDIGGLKAGDKKVFSYKYLFDKSKKRRLSKATMDGITFGADSVFEIATVFEDKQQEGRKGPKEEATAVSSGSGNVFFDVIRD